MKTKQIAYNFHLLREKCPQGDADAWRGFFNLYGALAQQLLQIYAAGDSRPWEQTLEALTCKDFERFRAMPQQSEREFLIELRSLLLERASTEPGARAGAAVEHQPREGGFDLERIAIVLDGLPLLHQEIAWFKMAGYTDATIESILRVTPAVARTSMEKLVTAFGEFEPGATDGPSDPREWVALLSLARAQKKEDCPTTHQLLRINDGQVSWYDKEPVEKRVSTCRHCLDNWTGLREVGYWRKAAPPLSEARVDEWLQRVPLVESTKKSFFERIKN